MAQELKAKTRIEAGDELDVQLSPFGVYPQYDDNDNQVMQICDEQAFNQIATDFVKQDKELLVDNDHNAENGGSTEAQAWVTKVWVDKIRGLMGKLRFTDVGANSVSAKRYRYLSPVWFLDDNDRPSKLVSVGLTNKNNIPVSPLLNREKTWVVSEDKNMETEVKKEVTEVVEEVKTEIEEVKAEVEEVKTEIEEVKAEVEETEQVEQVENSETEPKTLADIASALGLPPESTIDEVYASVETLVETVAEAETEKLEVEADELADEYAVENREAFKKLYVQNKETAKGVLQSLSTKVENKLVIKNASKPKVMANRDALIEKYKSLNGKEASDFLHKNLK